MQILINQNSVLPQLRIELIQDGRGDFHRFHDCIQNADITFTMINVDSGVIKISNAPCSIRLKDNNSCEEEYLICYDWKKRDTKDKGIYKGLFTIKFNDDLISEVDTYPKGELIVPIVEDLIIVIKY